METLLKVLKSQLGNNVDWLMVGIAIALALLRYQPAGASGASDAHWHRGNGSIVAAHGIYAQYYSGGSCSRQLLLSVW